MLKRLPDSVRLAFAKTEPGPADCLGYTAAVVPSFVRRYLDAFAQIDGWFSYDAALLFFAYCEALRNFGIDGDTLEIGVHHGLSAIAVAALTTGPSSRMVAVDLFEEEQDQNVSGSGSGHRGIFEANMLRY